MLLYALFSIICFGVHYKDISPHSLEVILNTNFDENFVLGHRNLNQVCSKFMWVVSSRHLFAYKCFIIGKFYATCYITLAVLLVSRLSAYEQGAFLHTYTMASAILMAVILYGIYIILIRPQRIFRYLSYLLYCYLCSSQYFFNSEITFSLAVYLSVPVPVSTPISTKIIWKTIATSRSRYK